MRCLLCQADGLLIALLKQERTGLHNKINEVHITTRAHFQTSRVHFRSHIPLLSFSPFTCCILPYFFMSAMASYGPNGQRRYFPEGASTTNLLPPQSSGQAQNTHQRSFNPPSRGPSLRSVRSTSSAVGCDALLSCYQVDHALSNCRMTPLISMEAGNQDHLLLTR